MKQLIQYFVSVSNQQVVLVIGTVVIKAMMINTMSENFLL